MHKLLTPHAEFLETARRLTKREHCDTVDSVMVLPFSAFTQALRVDLEERFDASLRGCFREEAETHVASGRAHLVDATSEDRAIVTEPLFRRPMQVGSGDCPFGTAYEAVDTFFNACNTLALCARSCCRVNRPDATPQECVAHLHAVVCRFVSAKASTPPADSRTCDASWAADALLLLNVLYPSELLVGEDAITPAIAMLAPFVQYRLREKGRVDTVLANGADVLDVEAVRRFWSAFDRGDAERCAWKWGVGPFLELLIEHNGSHRTPEPVIARFRTGLERAVRAVWLVHSPDGVARPPAGEHKHPASEAASPAHLARHHIDPVFAGSEEEGVAQRGALVGIKPHSYRQVLAEMLGSHIPDVECNVALNEGGLGLRVSSDPMILDKDGEERTDKSVSPVQTEGDELAYGKRSDKKVGSRRQKHAWDRNALLCKPLFTAIETPLPAARRGRGEFGFSGAFREQAAELAAAHQPSTAEFLRADAIMKNAATPTVAKAVNARL